MLQKIPGLKRSARKGSKQAAPVAATQPKTGTPKPKPTTAERVVDMLGVPGVLGVKISRDFMELRAWWPLLIPLMIWEARRTSQRERERRLRLQQERVWGKIEDKGRRKK